MWSASFLSSKDSEVKCCRNEVEVAKHDQQNQKDNEKDTLKPPSKLVAKLSDKKHTNAPVNFLLHLLIVTDNPWDVKSQTKGSKIQSIPCFKIIGCSTHAFRLIALKVYRYLGGMLSNVNSMIPSLCSFACVPKGLQISSSS